MAAHKTRESLLAEEIFSRLDKIPIVVSVEDLDAKKVVASFRNKLRYSEFNKKVSVYCYDNTIHVSAKKKDKYEEMRDMVLELAQQCDDELLYEKAMKIVYGNGWTPLTTT